MDETPQQLMSQYRIQGMTLQGWVTNFVTPDREEAERQFTRLVRAGASPLALRLIIEAVIVEEVDIN